MVLSIPEIFASQPGKGINGAPFEAETLIDLTGPPGSMTGIYYGLMFQLGRWGYQTAKIEEWISVSPVFKQYYDITLQQKQALEAQIKAGLGQIAAAIHDYELVFHDLRKYKEFLDYFTIIEEGKRLIEEKKKEEGEKKRNQGEQTLKAIFIDQVDAHTDLPNTPIALRSIVGRWPTIIADFMKLDDSDTEAKKIVSKLAEKGIGISDAEAVVLATKNKLYLEWRDRLFGPTVKDRYERILRLTEARKFSIDEYTRMLKPVVARFKMIADGLENPPGSPGRGGFHGMFFTPSSQAYSIDFVRVWAWKPFAPSEKYKITREFLDEISPKEAGFTKEEIEYLTEKFKEKEKKENLSYDEDLLMKGRVLALPVDGKDSPSIDEIVRDYALPKEPGKLSKIERAYDGAKIDIADVFAARSRLAENFRRRAADLWSAETDAYRATASGRGALPGEGWVFSPYFIFVDFPLSRTMLRMPNGAEVEDFWVENLRAVNKTQNVIIIHLLESMARGKQLENYISRLVGEVGGDTKTLEELKREEYPQIFKTAKELEEEKKKLEKKKKEIKLPNLTKPLGEIKSFLGQVLKSFGLTTPFVDYLRANGPYEFALDDRITEIYQGFPFDAHQTVLKFLQQSINVPDVKW